MTKQDKLDQYFSLLPYTDTDMPARTIQVKKSDLTKTLTENRKSHSEAYDEAMKKWEADMAVRANELSQKPTDDATYTELVKTRQAKPVEYLKDYDSAIKQMEMEQRELIELSLEEFDQLCCDEWSWSRNFGSNVYTSSTIRKKGII